MSDNISEDAIFIIKRARYVYVRDFKYTVCLSEYLSISFRVQWNDLFCFIFCSFDTIDFKTELYKVNYF